MKNLKILLLKGLPASGKTTYAKELVEKSNGEWKRINKDDLRSMIDFSKWSSEREKLILKLQNMMVEEMLLSGFNIVIDDTNFSDKHKKRILEIVKDINEIYKNFNIEVEEKFFDVDVRECIKRDLLRPVSVGEKVIRKMYNQYLRKTPTVEFVEGAPWAIICDIDGTLAHMNGRGPYDYNKIHTDSVDEKIKGIIDRFKKDTKIIIVSARDDDCRDVTEKWLRENEVYYDEINFRPAGEKKEDSLVKEDIFNEHIKDKYNVFFVLDDRTRVVDFWRSIGLKCLQVGDGDF